MQTAAKELIDDLADIIAAAPDGIPSGHFYAMLMGSLSLDQYNRLVGLMLSSGKITLGSDHVLRGARAS
jgi:hypothetical protein